MKRILSLLLALTLCLGMLPAGAWAEAVEEPTQYTEETEIPEETQEEALPEETEAEPEAAETAPEEETQPTEAETEPTEIAVLESDALEAPEAEESVTLEPITKVWINPEYTGIFSEAHIGTSDISGFEGDAVRCDSLEEVIEVLREGLVNREENPAATLVTTTDYQVDEAFLDDILDRLFDHTGVPTEGDYLLRDIGYTGIAYGGGWSTKDGVTTWTHTFILQDIGYFTTAAQEQEMDREVSRVLSSLALDGKTQKGKIDAIYDYLIHNVKYVSDEELADESNVIKYSSYAALVQHNAVCQGFAGAFYRLCLESGIDSRIVSSEAMNHAWNIVELDGCYYHLDATWDINWPDAPKYYLRGTASWLKEHKSSTTNYISELGDQFADGSFAAEYPVPEGDYGEAETPEVLSGKCGDDLTWTLDGNGTLTISGTGAMYDFEEEAPWLALEPQQLVLEEGITHISASAFYRCASLTGALEFPDSLTSVGYSAFCGCKGLTGTLVLPKNLTDIGEVAFADCGFTGDLALPDELTVLSGEAFRGCNGFDGKLTLPKGLTSIGAFAFRSCGFTTVEMYDAVETIGMRAFNDCGNLKKVIYHGTNEQWNAITLGDGNEALVNAELVGDCGYTIVFDGNGAEIGSMKNLEAALDVAVTLPESYFINPGYTFTGWNTQTDGKGKGYQPGDLVKNLAKSGTVTLYAQWTPSVYTARFLPGAEDCKGSVKDMPNLVNGKSYVFPKCSYTRTGYLFAGWGLDGVDDLLWNAGDKLKMTKVEEGYVAEFVARWTPITYTVRFNANKGTGKMPDQKGIPYDESTPLSPCAFTRKGYRFMGWNTKANGTGENVEEALKLTASNNGTVTLYAQWEGEPYQVTFHFGEETWTQTLHYGTAEALDKNSFENPGYTFKSWNTKENGKGKSYANGAKVTNLAETDLYAQWTANKYTVIFHSNLAKDTTKKQTLTYDAKETALTANGFSWKGHTFLGWAEAKDTEVPDYANKEEVRNLTTEKAIDLYAVWKVNEYTVVFNPNGAEGEEITQNMVYDMPDALTENIFERTGYTFSGWATTAKGKAVHTDGKTVKNLTDKDGVTVRLYAVWTPTTYTVAFAPGEGATGAMKPVKMTYGKTYTLTTVAFKRANYTFTGWRDADTWETYANKAKARDLSADGSTVTLVAQWVPMEYAITYKNLSTWEQEDLRKSYNVLSEGMPGDPSRPGCEFVGWFLDSGCKKPFTGFENIAKPGKLTLYPKWTGTPSKYTVHFAPGANGVTGKMADKKNLVCGKDYTLAACAFKRTGYQFAGWEIGGVTLANKAKFSDLPAYLDSFVSGGTVTLTAQWVKIGDGGDIPIG